MYENVQFAKRYVNIKKKKFKFVRILNNYACVDYYYYNYIFLYYIWGCVTKNLVSEQELYTVPADIPYTLFVKCEKYRQTVCFQFMYCCLLSYKIIIYSY